MRTGRNQKSGGRSAEIAGNPAVSSISLDGNSRLIDADVVVDASVGGNETRFLNRSCAPNCDAVIDGGRIWIETLLDIEPVEELVYDYAYVLEDRHPPPAKRCYPCSCGAITCRGTILAKKR